MTLTVQAKDGAARRGTSTSSGKERSATGGGDGLWVVARAGGASAGPLRVPSTEVDGTVAVSRSTSCGERAVLLRVQLFHASEVPLGPDEARRLADALRRQARRADDDAGPPAGPDGSGAKYWPLERVRTASAGPVGGLQVGCPWPSPTPWVVLACNQNAALTPDAARSVASALDVAALPD